MNKFRIARAGIDVNAGLARMCGDMEMYERLLIQFLDDTNYQQLLNAIEAKDVDKAFSAAHSIKGLVATLSMIKLYEAICVVVEILRNGSIEVEEYMPAVTEAYNKVTEAIIDMKNSKN